MRIILFLLGILSFLCGAVILAGAKSAIHEIEGFLLFVVSAIFISGASVIDSILLLHRETKALRLTVRDAVIKKAQSGPRE